MDTQLIFITGSFLLSLGFGIYLFKTDTSKEDKFVPSNSYESLIAILEQTIKREITHKYELDYKVKDIKIIYDFEKDLSELTKRILNGLSPTFFDELEYYHDRTYIIQVVMRHVESFLLEYTRANKIKTK